MVTVGHSIYQYLPLLHDNLSTLVLIETNQFAVGELSALRHCSLAPIRGGIVIACFCVSFLMTLPVQENTTGELITKYKKIIILLYL